MTIPAVAAAIGLAFAAGAPASAMSKTELAARNEAWTKVKMSKTRRTIQDKSTLASTQTR